MSHIVGLLNNGHTRLIGKAELYNWFQLDSASRKILAPWVRILEDANLRSAEYWFGLGNDYRFGYMPATYSGGQYILTARATGISGKTLPIGSTITEVNGLDIHGFVDSHRGIGWQPYDPIRKRTYDRVLRLPEGQNTVAVRAPDGSHITETFIIADAEAPRSLLSPELHNGPFTLETACLSGRMIDGETAYLAIHQMGADQGRVPDDELRAMREFVSGISGIPALIIDVRGNPGGENALWCTLVSMLTSCPLQMQMTVAVKDGAYVSSFYDTMVTSYGFV